MLPFPESDDRYGRPNARPPLRTGLRFGSFTDMGPLLRIRLVEASRTGPVWRPVPAQPTVPTPSGALELIVGLPGAVARVDPTMVAAWDVDQTSLWSQATANQQQHDSYRLAVMSSDERSIRVRLVAGEPWTTGLLAAPARLIGLGLTRRPSGPVAVAAPTSALLILADRVTDPATAGLNHRAADHSTTDLVEVVVAFATQIAGLGPTRLPLEPWLLQGEGSFAGRQNLE